MYMRSTSPKYVCPNCKNKVDPNNLEEIFHGQLESFLFSDTAIQGHLDKEKLTLKDKEELLEMNGVVNDVLPDGRALLTHSTERMAIVVQTADSTLERDLSWLDWSLLRDITPDGQWVLISESGEGGGPYGSVCLRMTDGSPPVVLGQGEPMQFSPDGQWVLAMMRDTPTGRWLLLPTGVGEARELDLKGLRGIRGRFTPDGSAVIVAGRFGDDPGQLHRFDLATGELAPIPGTSGASVNFEISPDGQWIALRIGTSPMSLIPIGGGEIRPIPGLRPEDELQPWIMEQKAVLVATIGTPPTRIDRIDLETGERTPFREIMPPDTSGVFGLRGFRFMPDGKTFGYTFGVQLDEGQTLDPDLKGF